MAGSFFRDVPDGADVYVLAHVLHNWDDDHAREILHGVRRATPDHGRLVVAEEVLAPPNQARVVMLAIGGQELTPGQWRALLADGGFELTRIRPAPNASFIDALPLR